MIPKKILIVDDDSKNIFALNAVLKSRGFDCISVFSGKEALRTLKSDLKIDVILMDMMMPEMDGYETIDKIKSLNHGNKIPIVAVTAQAMPGDKEKCQKAGADAYISKPINIDVLLDLLSQYK